MNKTLHVICVTFLFVALYLWSCLPVDSNTGVDSKIVDVKNMSTEIDTGISDPTSSTLPKTDNIMEGIFLKLSNP